MANPSYPDADAERMVLQGRGHCEGQPRPEVSRADS